MTTHERIQTLISAHDTVLFMKGTQRQPRCGFSATVVQILESLGVTFFGVDVLQDPEIREGIKAFTNWPTIPQLYHKGEFIGGCDIIRELYATGELGLKLGAVSQHPVKTMTVQQLKQKIDNQEPLRLYDVRTDAERKTARIEGSVQLTSKVEVALEMLPKDTLLVFQCHHGGRSLAAATYYANKGFRNVYNLEGGIEAWSVLVDPTVPRY